MLTFLYCFNSIKADTVVCHIYFLFKVLCQIKIYSTSNYYQFISIRSCTKMSTLSIVIRENSNCKIGHVWMAESLVLTPRKGEMGQKMWSTKERFNGIWIWVISPENNNCLKLHRSSLNFKQVAKSLFFSKNQVFF